jgi:integrase
LGSWESIMFKATTSMVRLEQPRVLAALNFFGKTKKFFLGGIASKRRFAGESLKKIAADYINERLVSVAYAKNLLRTARKAQQAGITAQNIEGRLVNRFIAGLESVSTATRKNVRRELLTLWRYGHEQGTIAHPPGKLLAIKAPAPQAEAWSLDEIRLMYELAGSDESSTGGVHATRICDWLPGWISIGYDTGLRHADILSLSRSEIRNDAVYKRAAKTGKVLHRQLSEISIAHANRLASGSPDGTLFSWFLTRRRSFTAWRDFLDRNGIAGSSKFLRRSCATYIAMESMEHASRYLQHSDARLLKHYVDESLLAAPPGPPQLFTRSAEETLLPASDSANAGKCEG